jgi:hypothetical protein
MNTENEDKWWDDKVWEYNIEGIQRSVLDAKDKRNDGLFLNKESYNFVVFIGNYSL